MKNTGHPPGSYYAATANPFDAGPPIAGDAACDVVIIGGGYTGLGAALELAKRGLKPLVVEAAETGSGASGRNGGQVHTGHRRDMGYLESLLGVEDARKLWDIAEEAKAHLKATIAEYAIECDFAPGLTHASHKRGYLDDYKAEVERLATVYDYHEMRYLDHEEVSSRLGTRAYFGGSYDAGSGHLHPLNWALGLARAAQSHGARISERTRALRYRSEGGKVVLETSRGVVRADWLILAGDGYIDGIEPEAEARIMPINNFILATEPIGDNRFRDVLPGGEAASDSRFVVNYWRLTPDRRMLWGGGENYRAGFPSDLKAFIRPYMLAIYPELAELRIDYAWGGTLGITMKRLPYVRRLKPNVLIAAGYSGLGVMLGPYFGKLLGDAVFGTLAKVDLLAKLPAPAFPGGKLLRWPTMVAGLSYYALKDRL
jgi:gamma-glutamylputrescine oxidase